MKSVVVLAMHGSPPRDFPRGEMQEYFQLQARKHQHPPARGHSSRFKELEARMRAFPRNETNDPFWKGSRDLAAALEKACGLPVLLGFNEFCAPSLDEIFDRARRRHPGLTFIYAWPFDTGAVAEFLAKIIKKLAAE